MFPLFGKKECEQRNEKPNYLNTLILFRFAMYYDSTPVCVSIVLYYTFIIHLYHFHIPPSSSLSVVVPGPNPIVYNHA